MSRGWQNLADKAAVNEQERSAYIKERIKYWETYASKYAGRTAEGYYMTKEDALGVAESYKKDLKELTKDLTIEESSEILL